MATTTTTFEFCGLLGVVTETEKTEDDSGLEFCGLTGPISGNATGAAAQEEEVAPLDIAVDLPATTTSGGEAEEEVAPLDIAFELPAITLVGTQTIDASPLEPAVDLPTATFEPGEMEIDAPELNPVVEIVTAEVTGHYTKELASLEVEAETETDPTFGPGEAEMEAAPLNPAVELPATSLDLDGINVEPLEPAVELPAGTASGGEVEIAAAPLNPAADQPAATVDGEAAIDVDPLNPAVDMPAATTTGQDGTITASPVNPAIDLPAGTVSPEVSEIVAAPLNPEVDLPAAAQSGGESEIAAAPLNPEIDVPATDLEGSLVAALAPLNPEFDLPPATAAASSAGVITAAPVNPVVDLPTAVLASVGDELKITKQAIQVLGRAHSTVVPVTIDGDTVLLDLVPHNWVAVFRVETSFFTDVTMTETMREERSALREKPLRAIAAKFTGLNRDDSRRILWNMARATATQVPVPLYCDHTRLSAAALVTATTLHGDFRWRRFFAGARLIVHTWDADQRPTDAEIHVIETIAADRMSVTIASPGLTAGKAKYARVMPLIDCDVVVKQAGMALTVDKLDVNVGFLELPGISSLPATVRDTEPWLPFHDGSPVFTTRSSWSASHSFEVVGSVTKATDGRASLTHAIGTRPRFIHKLRVDAMTREAAWDIVQFFETCRGRFRRFWFAGPMALWDPVSYDGVVVKTTRVGDVRNPQDFCRYVAFVLHDETVVIRKVASVHDNGTNFLFGLEGDLPSTVTTSTVRKMVPAWPVRLTRDVIAERWTTDELCRVEFQMIDNEDRDARVTHLEADEDRSLLVTKQTVRVLGAKT